MVSVGTSIVREEGSKLLPGTGNVCSCHALSFYLHSPTQVAL